MEQVEYGLPVLQRDELELLLKLRLGRANLLAAEGAVIGRVGIVG